MDGITTRYLKLLHGATQRINGPLDPILGQPLHELFIGFEPIVAAFDRRVHVRCQSVDMVEAI